MVKLGGEGRHSYDISLAQAEFYSTAGFAAVHVAQVAGLFVKLSLVVFVRRLYTPSSRPRCRHAACCSAR